jgi:uncharacterized protein YecE (DUF72 family)
MVRIGCSGWNYDAWRGALYPEGMGPTRWLREYGRHFDTVEVNSTFYRLASRQAVEKWVADTPDDFCFTVKASRYLTHVKRLRDNPAKDFTLAKGLQRFYEGIELLAKAGKLGPTLWQLPANFRRDDERLANLLDRVPPGRHCVEFRDASWFADDVYELLRRHDAALVISDDPERPLPTPEPTAGWTFVRFHRGSRGRRGNYSPSELEQWARQIVSWRKSDLDVYAYFNNDWEAFAPRNAAQLEQLVAAA